MILFDKTDCPSSLAPSSDVSGTTTSGLCGKSQSGASTREPNQQATGHDLLDRFGRKMTYLRLSVTDRCDLRCTYCMSEEMTFLKHSDVLSLEELYRLSAIFIRNGVRKIRLTGGEPLVRKNVISLFSMLGRHLESGDIDELTLTTNGTQLARHVSELVACGVRRVNISLDTLDPDHYRALTRHGKIEKVLGGIDAALAAGLKVKINSVAIRGRFERDMNDMIRFCHERGMDLTIIEEMPLGHQADRSRTHLPLNELEQNLSRHWTLDPIPDSYGGPARFVRVRETGGRLGFIAPLSCNFCDACNRVRVECTGRLYTCMGHEGSLDLREALRSSEGDEKVEALIRNAVYAKPKRHSFHVDDQSVEGISRPMSVLGG